MGRSLPADDRGYDVLVCACHTLQHVISVHVDGDHLCIGVALSSHLPFWKRAWLGLKYALGFATSNYGHYDEFLFDDRDLPKLEAAIRKIQVERVFLQEAKAARRDKATSGASGFLNE